MGQTLTAQQRFAVDFGVRGGALLGQPLQSNPYSGLHAFPPSLTLDNVYGTAGPSVGVQLYGRVNVRFEAVYKRFSYQSRSSVPPAAGFSVYTKVQGHSWEYPLLATFGFGSGNVRPFLGGGMSLGGSTTSTSNGQLTVTTSSPPIVTTDQTKTTAGLPIAYYVVGGIEWRFTKFSLSPELRYARWTADTNSNSLIANRPNQLELVFGVTFQPFRSDRLKKDPATR